MREAGKEIGNPARRTIKMVEKGAPPNAGLVLLESLRFKKKIYMTWKARGSWLLR